VLPVSRQTKIVVTVGPSSWNEEMLSAMLREGVEAFRFNFSHADYERFELVAKFLRGHETPLRPVTLVADLQGPVVRLGEFEEFPVKAGERVAFCLPEVKSGECVPVEEPVFQVASEEDLILIEAGRLAFRVLRNDGKTILAQALVDGVLKPRKTVAVKGKEFPLPSPTPKDLKDMKFAAERGFDVIALSFVRRGEDVSRTREVLEDMGFEEVRLVAKIETRSAVERLEEVLSAADAVLVARGDLAAYFELEQIYAVQEQILRRARAAGKPTIVATQLLESMIENPLPTRSEVVDVITAVRMGADALMLAGETAAGRYPLEAVRWLKRIIAEAERMPEEGEGLQPRPEDTYDVIAQGVITLSEMLSGKVLAFSEKGNTARRLAKYKPKIPVYVYTNRAPTARYVNLLRGVKPVYHPGLSKSDSALFENMLEHAINAGLVSSGDIVVFTAGRRAGATDLITVERVKPRPL
jgi:pyruvate kinase